MLSCEEAAKLASESMDHKLPWRKRIALVFHMKCCGCRICGSFQRQMNAFRSAISCYKKSLLEGECPENEKLTSEARDRIAQKLKSD